MTRRYPNGTWCGGIVPLVVLLMPYALVRYAIDWCRARREASAGSCIKVVGMGPFPLPGEKARRRRALDEARELLRLADSDGAP
ncbi:hypothetical protein FHR83_007042 [Actinoplanes campanulatus]|uniref:Uncharacterized protein n=1 Tax=Actinoplanes campanulatus TaxID=113559 RepID=A0A7W5ANF3_9ACTN|nr:hypothetical protein [Actinoplanes campanulatus]MBB3099336.1 hypothetical protein [Actinoplanes campanulatus]GGN40417.1 hypothetical protein GCM10010109_69500 [Actinoplanes campanulatus]GID40653.1 hypothetical protein Aca09nite_71590 [Actinoplanes campanulatus]